MAILRGNEYRLDICATELAKQIKEIRDKGCIVEIPNEVFLGRPGQVIEQSSLMFEGGIYSKSIQSILNRSYGSY